MPYPLINLTMHDGSRHFLGLPAVYPPRFLWRSLSKLENATRGDFLGDMIETWFDFSYQGYAFSVHETYGEFWFFANDPDTPDPVLHDICDHFLALIASQTNL
ncbi:hypothetical protein [uncultured Pelagimonas sp.]|uniref:hypothetical protein n=1 Tax=uncultured Pelagimonas sp. TaxID=1618102 RepID=UPI002633A91B|nr:hypothetical protein [uncultured Pelagimonas sp.]